MDEEENGAGGGGADNDGGGGADSDGIGGADAANGALPAWCGFFNLDSISLKNDKPPDDSFLVTCVPCGFGGDDLLDTTLSG